MNVAIREIVEAIYDLPTSESTDSTIRYLFTYFNVNCILKRGLQDLAKDPEKTIVFSNILTILEEEVIELQSDVLRRIEEYGMITSTDVSSVDDMKVMHFLSQSLISKCLNILPTENLKYIANISYTYMKKQVFHVSPYNFKCIIIDKLDYMYNNENISIREIWDLYGRFGIYSLLKLLYLLNTRTSYENQVGKYNELL